MMSSFDVKVNSLKELPTKELKLKRHKDRKYAPVPPLRLRMKSTSPLSGNEMEKCYSDQSVSSPESIGHSPTFPVHSSLLNSPPLSPDVTHNTCRHFPVHSSTDLAEEDYDQPLDMSTKHVSESPPEIKASHQQSRPSVITCASALLRTQCNLSSLAHQMCTTNVSDCSDEKHSPCKDESKESCEEPTSSSRPGHRREIVSGSCDPVIDEHFRRSLGKDYQHIFSKSTGNCVSITVDDHFAKALGDTWHQIQQSQVSSASESMSPTSSLQPSPSSHILSQILS